MKLDFDYHNHTPLSRCSKKDYTVRDMVLKMRNNGLTRCGFSDHFYTGETDPAYSIRYVREQLDGIEDIKVFVGTEVDMTAPGVLDADEETLAPYDYVSVACPHWQSEHVKRPIRYTDECLAQEQYDMVLSLVQLPFVDVLVHPFTFLSASGFMEIDQRRLMSFYTMADYDAIIDGLLRNGIAFELHANLKKPDYFESMCPLIKRCVSRGVKFSLGSDAHEMRWVGSILGAGELIESLGIPDELAFVPGRKKGR